MQTTLAKPFTLIGTGLHTGRPVRMTVKSAPADCGIAFVRTDIEDRNNVIPARYDAVDDAQLCTRISNEEGVSVATIEHLMAAFAGCGVHNAVVEVNAPEIPVLDGSSKRFVSEILKAGTKNVDASVKVLRILKPVRVSRGDAFAELSPSETFDIDFMIDFQDEAIGQQKQSLNMRNGTFVRELSDCRTFCRQSDIDTMRENGLALGGSLENAVVVNGADVVNSEGFRRDDECVRHKMLDALGDLALAGAPIIGHYQGVRAGHSLTNQLLRKLFATSDAYELISADNYYAESLPGVGVTLDDLSMAV